MQRVALLILLSSLAQANWFTDKLASASLSALGFDVSDTCGVTRQDGLDCIKKYVDWDKNGKVSCEEFERAKDLFMPSRMKDALWLAQKVGFDVHFEQVLYGCDANHDCVFTEQDWIDSKKKCLPFKADLCKLKTACDLAATNTIVWTHHDWQAAKKKCAYFTLAKCKELEQQWMDDDKKAAAQKAYEEHMKKFKTSP
jgi:hypothetical protein